MIQDDDVAATAATALLRLADDVLLAQCDVGFVRGRGSGGQKRNKTSTAVQLRHRPTELLVRCDDTRSQHDNKRRAIKKLRIAIALNHRTDVSPDTWSPSEELLRVVDHNVSPRQDVFWIGIADALDLFVAVRLSTVDAAAALSTSSSRLVKMFRRSDDAMRRVNELRLAAKLSPLR